MDILHLGRARYRPVWEMQRRMQAERIASIEQGRLVPDRLILVEHEPVYTWGKRARAENLGPGPDALRALGAEALQVERGGDVTYHGPGQLVAYPIAYLGNLSCGKDLHKYMRGLEEVVIRVLRDYGLYGQRVAGATGVWISDWGQGSGVRDRGTIKATSPVEPDPEPQTPSPAKIAALGTRVSRWVTLHGLSLNVTNEPLAWFSRIKPCGIADKGVTSLQSLLGASPPMREVAERLAAHFERVFCVA